jgi:hypothetical protein
MALPAYDDPATGNPDDPETVKRAKAKAAANRLGSGSSQAGSDSDGSYSQLSSTMPGKPASTTNTPDPKKQEAIRRRLKKTAIG